VCEWAAATGLDLRFEHKMALEAGQNALKKHDFKQRLRRVQIEVSGTTEDLSDKCIVALLQSNGAKGIVIEARQGLVLPLGTHKLVIRYADGPFIQLTKKVSIKVISGDSPQKFDFQFELQSGHLQLHVFAKGRPLIGQCRCVFTPKPGQGAPEIEVACQRRHHLPAGDYRVTVACPAGQGTQLESLVVEPGQDRSHRVEI
jgi:hypothetical protein